LGVSVRDLAKEESSFSEEKEAKRLLSVGPREMPIASRAVKEQKFFASFFQKRSAFFCLPQRR
jgi:hypothetical protein